MAASIIEQLSRELPPYTHDQVELGRGAPRRVVRWSTPQGIWEITEPEDEQPREVASYCCGPWSGLYLRLPAGPSVTAAQLLAVLRTLGALGAQPEGHATCGGGCSS